MFTRFISLLVLVAPLVSATIQLATPASYNVGQEVTYTWTFAADDPNFSLQYVNPVFNSNFAIRNNVDVLAGSLTLVPSAVLPGTYVLQAFNIANNSDIYSSTAPFTIGAATSTTGSSSSTGSTPSTATSNGASTSKLTTANIPVTTASGASLSSIGTSTGTSLSGTSSSETAPSTTPSSAAVSSRLALTNACGYAVLLLSAVGGVAVAL